MPTVPSWFAEVSVQVQWGSDKPALEVRSSLGAPSKWRPVAQHALGPKVMRNDGEWRLDGVCYAIGSASSRPGWAGKMMLMQADVASGELLWPLRWPPHFEQGTARPIYYSPLDAETEQYVESARLFPRTWRDRAFVGTLMQDNLWHALFHAIPISEYFERVARRNLLEGRTIIREALDLVPRYTRFWPTPVQLAELGAAEQSWDQLLPVTRWVGWQLIVRGLNSSAWDRTAQATQRLMDQTGVWHCYRVMYGGHRVFWPSWLNETAMLLARPRLIAFRNRLMASFEHDARAATSSRVQERILLVLRRQRGFANEDEVIRMVREDEKLAAVVKFVRLEELTLAEQLALATTSTAIAGVHGQGLTFAAFLPADSAPWTGLLEVFPHMMVIHSSHGFYDYSRLAKISGVRYFRLLQPDSPRCFCRYFRECGDVTANEWLRVMLHVLRRRSEPQCTMWSTMRWRCKGEGVHFATSSALCTKPLDDPKVQRACRNITTAPPSSVCQGLARSLRRKEKWPDPRCVCSKIGGSTTPV